MKNKNMNTLNTDWRNWPDDEVRTATEIANAGGVTLQSLYELARKKGVERVERGKFRLGDIKKMWAERWNKKAAA